MMRRRLFRRLLALGAALSLAGACGSETADPGTGSETNWISGCTEDTTCASGECLCGICAERCYDSAPCADGLECVHQASPEFSKLCGTSSDPAGLCLKKCGPGAPCLNGFRCEDGLCMPAPLSDATGDPTGTSCFPRYESRPGFAGHVVDQVNVEDGHRACASEICLVANFQGLSSCPYGQEDPAQSECFVPGSSEAITVAVEPQLVDRPPEDAIYCSCHCDGPPGTEPFCACPAGLECRPMIVDLGLSDGEGYVGSYCVKEDTWVGDPSSLAEGPICDRTLDNCSDR